MSGAECELCIVRARSVVLPATRHLEQHWQGVGIAARLQLRSCSIQLSLSWYTSGFMSACCIAFAGLTAFVMPLHCWFTAKCRVPSLSLRLVSAEAVNAAVHQQVNELAGLHIVPADHTVTQVGTPTVLLPFQSGPSACLQWQLQKYRPVIPPTEFACSAHYAGHRAVELQVPTLCQCVGQWRSRCMCSQCD